MFPNIEEDEIANYLSNAESIDDAIDKILNATSSLESFDDFVKLLSKELKPDHQILQVDSQELLQSSFAFFKSNDFDPNKRLRVVFRDQPAIDAGGVRPQFFTNLFKDLCHPDMASRLFEGNPIGLLPICRSDTALSQMFVTIGKMIAYAAIHGYRPLHLSEAAFQYLLNGNIEDTLPYLKTEDLATGITKHYVETVSQI